MSRLSVPLRIHFLDNSKHLPNWPRSLSHFLLHHRKNVFAHRTEELPRCRHKKSGQFRGTESRGKRRIVDVVHKLWITASHHHFEPRRVCSFSAFLCVAYWVWFYILHPKHIDKKYLKTKFGDISPSELVHLRYFCWNTTLKLFRNYSNNCNMKNEFSLSTSIATKMINVEYYINSSTTHLKLRERGRKENPRETFSCLIASQYCLLS